MSLTLRFWGTRGSIPSPGPTTVRYGGNTPCVELRTADGWLVILDAGTGIRELGRSLLEGANGAPVAGDIFLTHAHWDHIQGIPFFAPLFRKGNQRREERNPLNVIPMRVRSEEHTSELQSHSDLVCRLLLETKKKCKSTCS